MTDPTLDSLPETVIREAIASCQIVRHRSYWGRLGIAVQEKLARQRRDSIGYRPLGAGEDAPLDVLVHRQKREEEAQHHDV